MQRAGVAGKRQAAQRLKAGGVGAGHRQRIVHAHRAGPVHGVAEHRVQRRLERNRLAAGKRHVGDAEAGGKIELRLLRVEQPPRAIDLEPAPPAEMTLGTRLGGERLMLGNGARQQRPHDLSGFDEARRLRGGAKRREPGRDRPQEPEVIIGQRRPLQRDARHFGKARGKGRRKYGIALDDAGIAVGRAPPRLAAIDERHRQAALDQRQSDRGADDPGAKHDDIGARQDTLRCGCRSSQEQVQ